jgi:hypothetical protein
MRKTITISALVIRFNVITWLLVWAFLTSGSAQSHELKQSYIFLSINDTSIDGRIEMTIADLNSALSLELPIDKTLTEREIAPHMALIKDYIGDHITINFDEGLILKDYFLHRLPIAQYLAINFAFQDLAEIPPYLNIDYSILFDQQADHVGMVIIENDWRSGTFNDEANIALVFTPVDTSKRLDLTGASVTQGYLEMVKLGMHHILEGIDHVLFLIALLLPSVVQRVRHEWLAKEKFYPAFIYVVKIVTVFTLAHTVTLTAATLGLLSLPSRLVESVIAISIAFAALDILVPLFRSRIWLIVFAFGLFHGFGFASVLAEYPIPDSYLTLSLLMFNVGVELGQLVIIVLVFPLLFLLRKQVFYRHVILNVGAVLLILVSLYWFLERGFLIDLPAGAVLNYLLDLVGMGPL